MPRRASNPAKRGGDRLPRQQQRDDAPGEHATGPGIPDLSGQAVTPEMREAVARLATERDRLREELAKAHARIASLERLADEDALTAVANRRAFVRQLAHMIALTQRYGVPASIAYFDVNNMKQINDSHGHPAGDAALRQVARVLTQNVRSSDVIGRLGGDEFGVILAHADENQANRKAAALAEAVAERPLRWGEFTVPVSVAYGVYAFSGSDDPQHAIEAADKAMYRQKRAASPPGA